MVGNYRGKKDEAEVISEEDFQKIKTHSAEPCNKNTSTKKNFCKTEGLQKW